MKFKVAVSGWGVVEVEAKDADLAREKVQDEAPDLAGDLYDLEVHEAVLADEPFQEYTEAN